MGMSLREPSETASGLNLGENFPALTHHNIQQYCVFAEATEGYGRFLVGTEALLTLEHSLHSSAFVKVPFKQCIHALYKTPCINSDNNRRGCLLRTGDFMVKTAPDTLVV